MKRTHRLVLACVLLCALSPGAAWSQPPWGRPPGLPQTIPDRPMPGRPAESPTEGEPRQPVFRTRVEYVEVAVIATDREGRFVRDLRLEDFELLDQGKRQAIQAFAKVEIPLAAPRSARTDAPGALVEPRDDVATSALDPDTRLFVLVLDDLHVASERTIRVRQAARLFVEQRTSPGDLLAVTLVGGRKDLVLGFTRDRGSVLAAIDTFTGQKLRSATYERYLDKRLGGGAALREGRDPMDSERAYRARVSMATLADATRMLATLRGRRKSVLYFGEGIDYNVADIMGRYQRYAAEVNRALAGALSAATRNNVTIYGIDPRGLAPSGDEATEMPIYAEQQATSLAEPGRNGEMLQSIANLRTLAEATGGFALVDQNEFDAAFERIERENSVYYVLGFQPQGTAAAGTFRKLQVRVGRRGVTVNARRGYLVGSDRPQAAQAVEAPNVSPALLPLLGQALPDPGLGIRLQVIPLKAAASLTALHLVVEVDGRDLDFVTRGARFAEMLELALLTVDGSGHADHGRQVTLALKLTTEELERAKAAGVRWQSALDLAPGHYQVRAAAHAVNSSRRGLAIAEIDVPDFAAGQPTLSGIALTSAPAARPITSGDPSPFTRLGAPPSGLRQFVRGDRFIAAVLVYPGSDRPNGLYVTAQIDTAGQDVRATPQAAFQHVALDPSVDCEEMAFAFDTSALSPGQYVLQVRVHSENRKEAVAARSVPLVLVLPH